MTKTLEVINEAIHNPKHLFRKVENQPKKPLKHRYERRKIRGYLQLGERVSGDAG
jgi:hypothetical protein